MDGPYAGFFFENWKLDAVNVSFIIIIIIIFIHSESAHAQALASYIVTEFWAGQQCVTVTCSDVLSDGAYNTDYGLHDNCCRRKVSRWYLRCETYKHLSFV